MAYYDLNLALPSAVVAAASSSSAAAAAAAPAGGGKKNKKDKHAKQQQQQQQQRTPTDKEEDPLSRLTKEQKQELEARVADVGRLGYSVMAFNHVAHSKFDPSVHRNPFHSPASAGHLAGAVMPVVSRPAFPALAKGKAPITQLNRLTLVLDSVSEGKSGNGLVPAALPALASFDLLAVRPTTSNTFNAACLTHTDLKPGPSFDIISLDLASAPRLPFHLKRTTIGKALDNGAVFEICYADALPQAQNGSVNPASPDRLRNLISNTRDLLRVTNGGKGLIISSSAASVMGLRSPGDVVNLATIFGFSPQLAKDAMSETCRRLLRRAETRRSFRGVVGLPAIVTDPPAVVQAEEPIAVGEMDRDANAASRKRKTEDQGQDEAGVLPTDGSLASFASATNASVPSSRDPRRRPDDMVGGSLVSRGASSPSQGGTKKSKKQKRQQ